jgi:hypothetical protein
MQLVSDASSAQPASGGPASHLEARVMTKFWKLSLMKDGQRIMLFAATTDEMVKRDLGAESSASLIHTARQYHRRPQSPLQDHRDLAIGAFMAYAAKPPYDLSFEEMEVCSSEPEGAPVRHVGGHRNAALVPIWEDCAPDDPDYSHAEE